MNSSLLVRRLAGAAVLLAASFTAHSQPMQLRYTGTVRFTAPGAGWFAPGELVTDAGTTGRPLTPVQIDLTFDTRLTPHSDADPDESLFLPPSDPIGAGEPQSMRLRFGRIDYTVPLDRIEFDAPHGLVRFFADGAGAAATLAQDNLPFAPRGSRLPTDFTFPDRVGFFAVTIDDNATVAPGFFEADLLKVTPVPEPAAYGFFATLLLGCFVLRRHRRRQ